MSSTAHTSDVEMDTAAQWLAENRRMALATVVHTWGSAPRAAGSHLLVDADGNFQGSVSGGCIEGAVITEVPQVLSSGEPQLLSFGVTNERAWEVGLTCGGKVGVYLEPYGQEPTWTLIQNERDARRAVARVVDLDSGRSRILGRNINQGDLNLDDHFHNEAAQMLHAGRSGLLRQPSEDADPRQIFIRTWSPPMRLIIVGAVHIAQALAPMARIAGFQVTIVDPRKAFANTERFPDTPLLDQWPEEALAELKPDAGSAVITLGHDPKIDDEALIHALHSEAFYIGALGSTRTHAKRLKRLEKHHNEETLQKIHAPIGLNLGGRAPQQIAVAILAQIIQVRCGAR